MSMIPYVYAKNVQVQGDQTNVLQLQIPARGEVKGWQFHQIGGTPTAGNFSLLMKDPRTPGVASESSSSGSSEGVDYEEDPRMYEIFGRKSFSAGQRLSDFVNVSSPYMALEGGPTNKGKIYLQVDVDPGPAGETLVFTLVVQLLIPLA